MTYIHGEGKQRVWVMTLVQKKIQHLVMRSQTLIKGLVIITRIRDGSKYYNIVNINDLPGKA